MKNIIGRLEEKELLSEALHSNKSELIAVYGRRRIGKTFLIRSFYKHQLVFETTGLYRANTKEQLKQFSATLHRKSRSQKTEEPANWMAAFLQLQHYLDKLNNTRQKKVIFLDEFPWMATARSMFLPAFEHFWNNYCSRRQDLIVVICGSAASYMIQKIVKNKGGLHNRITRHIRLMPFTLYETAAFLKARGINYTYYDITQLYLCIGGVPHYLDQIQKGKSVAQNIDKLCFSKDGLLRIEFEQLYASLFENSRKHVAMIKTLSRVKKGVTRQELLKSSDAKSGGEFSKHLEELIESGFVSEYQYYGNKRNQSLFRLSDEYSLFYLKFIEKNLNSGAGTWQRLHKSPGFAAWSGFSFETVCLKHYRQIKNALGIAGIYTRQSSWFNNETQVDLLIDRDDNVINLCEMKFYNTTYTISKDYYQKLKAKVSAVQTNIAKRKNVFLVLITTFGIKENEYSSELVEHSITINALFDA